MRVMVQKGISFILVMVLVLGALNGLTMGAGKVHAAVAFAGGTGTSSDPYQIANADQLNEVRNHLGAGIYFILTSDIDLSSYAGGAGWTPIGANYENPFYGNLNGNGFTIRNLTINTGGADHVGLFGVAAYGSSFANIILENVNVRGRYYVGGLIGIGENNVSNVYVTGNVVGIESVGGLAGCLYGGSINNSYFIGSVIGSQLAGGLVGYHYGDIVNSYAAGNVTGNSPYNGGLIGLSDGGAITNSFYDKTTSGQVDTGKGEGKTTEEMKKASTYTGWDFTSQWYVFEGQYPQLWAFTKLIKGTTAGTTKLFHVATGMEYSLNGNPYVPITGDSVEITVVAEDSIDVRVIAAPSSHRTLTVDLSDIRGLIPPALTADTTENYTANDIEMTFVNDPVWLSGITAVKDGATTLDKGTQYTIEAGKLKIFAGVLAKGNNSIIVTAPNYDDAVVTQMVTNKQPPALTADTTSPYPTNEIEITYTDDPTWRGVITAVKDGTTTLVQDTQYKIEAGKIKIFAGVLAKGNHSITVTAINYDAAAVSQFVSHQFSGAGEGSQSNPFQIATADQLNEVRYLLASDIYFELVDDIDLGVSPYVDGEGWLPIGKYGEEFQGKLDGKGYKITGLKIARSTMDVGLFGRTSSTSSLNNMGLENINLSGNDQMGGLVGFNQGAISNSYSSTGSVSGSGKFYLGGLVGYNQGSISNSYSNMVIVSGRGDIGGLVGTNKGSISNSYATGSVSAILSTVGGLVGSNYPGIGKVNNSFYESTTTETDTGKGWSKTTELMKTESTYSGWFTSNVWGIDSSINAGYPYLKAFYRFMTYNGNGNTGGNAPTDSKIYTRDADVVVVSNGNLVKSDHNFTGWNTLADGSGTSYEEGDTFAITANMTLYAQWISTAKGFSTFSFSFAGLSPTVTGIVYEANKTIALTVPYGTDITALVPTFTTTGASVKVANTNQVSGTTAQDFTSAVTYTVVAADSSEQDYTVTVTVAENTAKAISTFSFEGLSPTVTGIVYEVDKAIVVIVPYGTDVTALVPTFTTTGASVKVASADQVSGTTAHNFNSAVTYTVVAADGSEQDYTVTVTIAGNTEKAISTFNFAGWSPTVTGIVYEPNKTIALTVPYGTDVTALVPTFTTTGASVRVAGTDQVSGTTAQDFTSAVTYTVVAADGSEQEYTVIVTVAENTEKAINAFSLAGLSPTVTGIVNEVNKTIALTVPYGTNVTALVPTFTTTGASVKVAGTDQVSGTTAHNFTSAVTYTVVAADGSEQDYTVIVTVAANTETPYSGGEVILPVSDAPVISTDGQLTLPIGKSGEVSLLKGVTVSIPADASKQELKITIEKLLNTQNLLTKQEVLASPIFEILKNFSENFRKPVTLTFVFDPASLKSNQRAVVFYYDEVKKVWVEVGGKVKGNQITIEVDHFTKYAVMAVGEVKDKPTTEPNVSFSDVTGHWAEADIKQAVSSGIVRGYSDGTFKPGQTVTRAEFAVMLIHALKPQGEGVELIFTDTAKIGAWARKAVAQAVQAGIIKGYSDGAFRPNAEITRAEMASMIAVASGQSSEANAVTGFVDDDEIPTWARGSVAYVKQAGIIQGKGGNTFAPQDNATRAEAVTVLLKLLAHIKE
ncbi:S-layer homology domain-containing protein [Paenibacillus sp. GCM10012303]|uniref:S-layer homology domain-containing protein n=1 Tax=Paenibacillus sp. GCM10012303 TaxID=3317340 RepID=UPI00361EC5DF